MKQKGKKDISRLHMMLRKNKYLFPLRKMYFILKSIKRYGIIVELQFIKREVRGVIARKNYYKKIMLSEREREFQKNKVYENEICFSILVPLYNTPEHFLREMIESVQNQTYGNWQLCLADGSDQEHANVGKIVKKYQKMDSRIVYQALERNGGISKNTNMCIEISTGDFLVLFDHDDILHEAALYELRKAIDEHEADFIYTDEAIFSKNPYKPYEYHFKKDFALDDLRSNNYICHITCFSRGLLQQVGGFRSKFDGSQDFDFILRLTEKAKKIVHIPKVLYFWRCHDMSVASDISAKTYCIDAGRMAVEEHLKRMGIAAKVRSSEVFPVIYRVTYSIIGRPKISIIVWNENIKKDYLDVCIKNIQECTSYSNYEILKCNSIIERNQMAKEAKGEYLVFIDSRCIFRYKNWLKEMVGVVQREETGVVGAKVSYLNDTIRDAGLILGVGVNHLAVNSLYQMYSYGAGGNGIMYFTHNVSAVTDTCFIIRQSYFWEVNGFDEMLPDWYAGLDLSLKLREKGKINVVNPYSEVYFGFKEKERDLTGQFKDKNKYTRILKRRWKGILNEKEPYYNANLDKKTGDYEVDWETFISDKYKHKIK